MKKMRANIQNSGIFLAFIILLIVFSLANSNFFTVGNISNIIVQCAIIAVVGIGQTLVIISGGIDLSVGSIVSFIGIATGLLLQKNVSLPLAIGIALLIGALIGLISGLVITYGQVPSFIMTLGMMGIATGGTLLLNNGQSVSSFPKQIEVLASTKLFGIIPIFVGYLILLYAGIYILLTKTVFGKHLYALGGSRKTAWLSGVRIKLVEVAVYTFCGFFAAFSGIMLVARMSYASPTAGSSYAIDSIAAVVVGGTAMTGGKGNILGTLLGALFLAMIKNGLTMLNVSAYLQEIIIGVVIVVAVFLDRKRVEK